MRVCVFVALDTLGLSLIVASYNLIHMLVLFSDTYERNGNATNVHCVSSYTKQVRCCCTFSVINYCIVQSGLHLTQVPTKRAGA